MGQPTWKGGYSDEPLEPQGRLPRAATSPPASAQENFEFERAYVTFKTGIGLFQVGYQGADEWGTVSATTAPRAPGSSMPCPWVP